MKTAPSASIRMPPLAGADEWTWPTIQYKARQIAAKLAAVSLLGQVRGEAPGKPSVQRVHHRRALRRRLGLGVLVDGETRELDRHHRR